MPNNYNYHIFEIIQPVLNMCSISCTTVDAYKYIRKQLANEDCIRELGLTYEQCKEQSKHNNRICEQFEVIRRKYRRLLPVELLKKKKNKEWYRDYIEEIYNEVNTLLDTDCRVELIKTYKRINEYCSIYGKIYGKRKVVVLKGKVDKYIKCLKLSGYARVQIINRVYEFLKSVKV